MTPTPEEVRNKIATKHGFEDWRHVISFHGGFDSSRYVQLYNLTNEAMRDYAEALYTERIEKAGSELPDLNSLLNEFPGMNNHDKVIAKIIWEKMKQAASVVIAKWKQMYININHQHSETVVKHRHELEQKDKEIEELKTSIHNYNSQFKYKP